MDSSLNQPDSKTERRLAFGHMAGAALNEMRRVITPVRTVDQGIKRTCFPGTIDTAVVADPALVILRSPFDGR